jgi:hypothetical protein
MAIGVSTPLHKKSWDKFIYWSKTDFILRAENLENI